MNMQLSFAPKINAIFYMPVAEKSHASNADYMGKGDTHTQILVADE